MSNHLTAGRAMMDLLIARADAACARYRNELDRANLHHKTAAGLRRRLHVMENISAQLRVDRADVSHGSAAAGPAKATEASGS